MSGAEGALPLRLHMNLDESGMTTVQRGCSGLVDLQPVVAEAIGQRHFSSRSPPDLARKVTQIAIVIHHGPRYGDLLEAIVAGSKKFADAYHEINTNLREVTQDVAAASQ